MRLSLLLLSVSLPATWLQAHDSSEHDQARAPIASFAGIPPLIAQARPAATGTPGDKGAFRTCSCGRRRWRAREDAGGRPKRRGLRQGGVEMASDGGASGL